MNFVRCLLVSCLPFFACSGFDTTHFFRPPFLDRGPWLEKSWLSALFIEVADGKTHHARNCAGHKVPLLDLYGSHNVAASALNVPNASPLLQSLAALPAVGNFGTVSLNAKEHMTEVVIEAYQNFVHGLFLHLHLPIRRLTISPICLHDLSNPASNSAAWQTFLRNPSAILEPYGLSLTGYKEHGVGDFGIALGWTKNYECFEHIDFLDTTLQVGVTTPTSKQLCPRHLFTIPLGYNGHTGFFGKGDISVGFFDWMTAGATLFGMGFNKHLVQQRVKTSPEQSGLIILERQPVDEHLGSIISCELLLRADHFLRGCSLDFAYQFQHQWKSSWFLCASKQCYTIPDQRLQNWSMHTINIELSYDFSNINHPCAPTFGILVNIPVAGHRIFTPTMGGLSYAMMTSWSW